MNVLFWSLMLFAFVFFVQLAIWRTSVPKRQIKVLAGICVFTVPVGLFVIKFCSGYFDIIAVKNFSEYAHIILFFVSLALAYLITFSAIEVDSPSLVMVRTIAQAGPEGLDKQLFIQMMNDDIFIKPRVVDLLNDNMVYFDGKKYQLATKGILIAWLFHFYRKLLNAPKGG